MPSSKGQTAITKVMNLFHEWDKGGRASIRSQILNDFVTQHSNKTGPELELEFAQAASLFLARITAWLRLTYMSPVNLDLKLQGIHVFLNSASGKDLSEEVTRTEDNRLYIHLRHRFLAEFIEVGGVLTCLEILGQPQIPDNCKSESLKVILTIALSGRKYKELICESYGIRSVAECMARCNSEDTQAHCRQLLHELSQGNPKYEIQVYKGLIALLPSTSPKAQQMAAQTLRIVQPLIKYAHPKIVEPTLNLLQTLHLEVQFEAIELIKDLTNYEEVRHGVLKGLVGLLIPPKLKPNKDVLATADDVDKKKALPQDVALPVHVQQAAAAKTIGIISQANIEYAEIFVQARVMNGLMIAMGNTKHADSQRQASMTLELLCRMFAIVGEMVEEAMGDSLYNMFMADSEGLYMHLDAVQADVLQSNKLNLSRTDMHR